MAVSLNSRDSDKCGLQDNITWDTLYSFLGWRVAYWVRSSGVSLWDGQEQDIVADIIQEAITSTFQYVIKYSVGTHEGEAVSLNALMRLSMAIAYKHYQDFRRRDAQFVCARPERLSSQGYAVYYQQIDLLQNAVDNVLQKWCSVRLGNEIANIPGMPRTALLIDLANRTRSGTQPTLLERALLEAGIQLQDYQRALPNDPIERGKHTALLHQAYERIIRQQENLKKQKNTELIHGSQKPSLTFNDSESDPLEGNPELEDLAAHLEAAATLAVVDPAFQGDLRDKLLSALAKQPHYEAVEGITTSTPETTRKRSDAVETSIDQEPTFTSNNSGSDLELPVLAAYLDIALAAYLDTTSSFAMIDPAFRKMMQDELARIPAVYDPAGEVERILDETECTLARLFKKRESGPL